MTTDSFAPVAAWLLAVAVHGGMLLALAALIDRLASRSADWRELLWRCALFGGVLSAGLQPLTGMTPLSGHWRIVLPASAPVSAPAHAIGRQGHDPQRDGDAVASMPGADQRLARLSAPAPTVRHAIRPVAKTTPGRAGAAWSVWIVVAWLVGAGLALTRLGLAWQREQRRLRRLALIPASHRAMRDLAALAARARVRVPRMYAACAGSSAMALPGRRIVVPQWALDTLGRPRLRAMLAHELAHITRRDPQWKLVAAAWHALFWFLPLAGLARRRLDGLAEFACDAFAARQTGSSRRVAECLAACVEHQVQGRPSSLAPAMAVHESSLMQRIDRLLGGVAVQTTHGNRHAGLIAALVPLVACVCLPAVMFPGPTPLLAAARTGAPRHADDAADSGVHSHVSVHEDGDSRSLSFSFSDGHHSLSASVDGNLALNAAETDVADLGAGGTATFQERRDGVNRRLDLSEHDGTLQRRYFVDGQQRTYDAAAQRWFAGLLPTLIRETGFGARARVKRMLAKAGPGGVLDEVERIHSNYVRGVYLKWLCGMAQMTAADLDRAVRLAGAIGSDYERGRALGTLFASQHFSDAQQVNFLHQCAHFHSDYERAQLLISVAPRLADSTEVRQAWIDAARGVSSDYERRRTFEAMLKSGRLDDAQLASLIAASNSIGSDYEHRVLLTAIASQARDVDALAPDYTRSVQSIGSDFERRQALLALIGAGKFGASSARAVLDTAAHIGSDYECRELLVALARVMPDDARTLAHYREVAARLSRYEREAALSALVR